MFFQPVSQVLRILLQSFQGAGFTLFILGIGGGAVRFPVLAQHLLGGFLPLVEWVLEVCAGAGLGFAGVGRELDPVDGKHLAADQSLAVAQGEHLCKKLGGEVAHLRNEGGQGGEVGLAVSGQGDEEDVVAAGGFDLAARNDAPAVGEKDDLEEDGGIVGGSAFDVVVVAGVESGEVEFFVHQMTKGEFKGARLDLPVEIHRQEFHALVDGFESGHGRSRGHASNSW